jgi:phage terminase small subunit
MNTPPKPIHAILLDAQPSSSQDPVIRALHRAAASLRHSARKLGVKPRPRRARWARKSEKE